MKYKNIFSLLDQRIVIVFCILICFTSCKPSFFDLQTAKMLGAGKVEIAAYTSGLNLGVGLTDRVDLDATLTNDGSGIDIVAFNILTIAPKLSLDPDKVAFYLPVSRLLVDKVTIIRPSVLFTSSLSDDLSITTTPKLIISANDNLNNKSYFGLSENIAFHIPKTPISICAGISGVRDLQLFDRKPILIDASVGLVFNFQ